MRLRKVLVSRFLLLIGLMLAAGWWAYSLIDSLYSYRSPLHSKPPIPGIQLDQTTLSPLTRRVVIVLVDALRVDTAKNPNVMPQLNLLRQAGASATMNSRPPSYSAPSYSVIFTGAWPEISDGPALNLEYEAIPSWTQDNLFSAANRSGLKTAVSAYYWFEKLIPTGAVNASFFTSGEDQYADRQVISSALPWLTDSSYALVLIHLDQIDYAGHYEQGPLTEAWEQAARRADGLIAEVSALLDYSQDTLMVISDHGQIARGGHGGNEPDVLTEPFVLVGAGVKPGIYGDIQMVDIAPSIAALLRTNIPASSQGRPLEEMLYLKPDDTLVLQAAIIAQQQQLLQAYQSAIGVDKFSIPAEATIEAYQNLLEQARMRRLNFERMLRALPAMLAIVLPIRWFWLRRKKEFGWYLFAFVVFQLLFNLRYALVEGRTYSLSSVTSPEDLVFFSLSTTALTLLAVWGAAFILSGTVKIHAAPSIMWTIDFVLAIISLISIPLIWSFFMNGALVTWTLPEFGSMFMGFLALLQVLSVSIIGISLALLIALSVFIRDRILKARQESTPPFSGK